MERALVLGGVDDGVRGGVGVVVIIKVVVGIGAGVDLAQDPNSIAVTIKKLKPSPINFLFTFYLRFDHSQTSVSDPNYTYL